MLLLVKNVLTNVNIWNYVEIKKMTTNWPTLTITNIINKCCISVDQWLIGNIFLLCSLQQNRYTTLLNWFKSDSEDIYNVTNVCCSFEFTNQRILKELSCFHKNIKQHNIFNIDNNKTFFLSTKSEY